MGMYTTVHAPGFGDVQFKYGNDGCFHYGIGDTMVHDSVPDGLYEGLGETAATRCEGLFTEVAVTVKGNRVVKLERVQALPW